MLYENEGFDYAKSQGAASRCDCGRPFHTKVYYHECCETASQ